MGACHARRPTPAVLPQHPSRLIARAAKTGHRRVKREYGLPAATSAATTPGKCLAKRVSSWGKALGLAEDPYGQLTVLDADFTADADNVSDYGNAYLFTGRRFDAETGLYYYRARYYHAGLGRFVSRDPMGDIEIDNLYLYCGGNPPSFVDPSGMIRLDADCVRREMTRCFGAIGALDGTTQRCITECLIKDELGWTVGGIFPGKGWTTDMKQCMSDCLCRSSFRIRFVNTIAVPCVIARVALVCIT